MSNEAPPPGVVLEKAVSEPEDAAGKRDPLFRQLGLWAAALGGAIAWFVDLVARYFLVEAGWARTREPRVALIGAAALVVALVALAGSLRLALRLRSEREAPARFVAALGVALNALFALLIASMLSQHVLLDGGG